MEWKITYVSRAVFKKVRELPGGILGSYHAIIDKMKILGPNLGMPYTKPMSGGLFEIRAKGKEGIGRIFFATQKGKEIIILHSFVKKTQKAPQHEIDIARKKLKEVNEDAK